MPITPYLTGQPFDPETIREMSHAFVGACEALGLRPIDDAVTRLVAEKVIALRQRGVRNDELRARTVAEIGSIPSQSFAVPLSGPDAPGTDH